ncbi:MAG: NAD(P)/FAD-dependent oxidoreductase [Actinomycetota bacterium]
MSTDTPLPFDPEALRARYAAERDKRVRDDGVDQYLDLTGSLAHYSDHDPYVEAGFTREPVSDTPDVVIVGGGFSGLLAAARLVAEGVESFRIVESGGDFGGTWYWNRYPGAQCDTDAYCYLPLLEELGYMPNEKYSYAPEIFEHAQRIGHHYELYDRTLFQTKVRTIRWDEDRARWRVETDRDDDLQPRFVIMALGTITRPKMPGVDGIEDFEGHSFHTSRWDYDYTGGDTSRPMTKLADKKVAIIGTGATAIQCVPRLAEDVDHLYVFQRTPSTVGLRLNTPTDPEWFAGLQPGWQRERRENFAAYADGKRPEHDLVDDSWTAIFRAISSPKGADRPTTREERNRVVELQDFIKMEELRQRVDDTVADPGTAEALKPWYQVMCKRPTFNDQYLPAFNSPNVTLVDVSDDKGIERISPRGVVAGGTEYEVDLIVYATGYHVTRDIKLRLGIDVAGRHGVMLHDHWADGPKSLHGFTTRGFPNWFYIGASQNAFSVNMTSMFDQQATHIAYLVAETMRRDATTVEPSEDGQREWCELIESFTPSGPGFLAQCTPGYYNQEGAVTEGNAFLGAFRPGLNAFGVLLEEWRAEGEMAGLELVTRPDDG